MKNERLIGSTMIYKSCNLIEALSNLKSNGFEKAELCATGDFVTHFDFINATDDIIENTVKEIEQIGIQIVCINIGGIGNIDDDNNVLEVAKTAMENAIKLAVGLKSKLITYECGNIKPGQDRKKRLAAIAAFNKEMAYLSERANIVYSVEAPHKLSIAEQRDEIAEYWALQDERVKCTFDDAHNTFAGEDAVEQAKVYCSRVAHVHLRDAVKGNSLLHYGEGSVDFESLINVFENSGYLGYYSMEFPAETEEMANILIRKSIEFFEHIF